MRDIQRMILAAISSRCQASHRRRRFVGEHGIANRHANAILAAISCEVMALPARWAA